MSKPHAQTWKSSAQRILESRIRDANIMGEDTEELRRELAYLHDSSQAVQRKTQLAKKRRQHRRGVRARTIMERR